MSTECILQVAESVTVIIASVAAICAVNSWRREMKGRKEYELVEEVLSLFYEARDKLRVVRSPMGHSEEGKSRKPRPNETPEETEIINKAYVVFERYQKHQETFNRLHALRYRFMAVLGSNKGNPFDELHTIENAILVAANSLSRLWLRANTAFLGGNEERIRKLE